MFHVKRVGWRCLRVAGSLVWAVVVLGMFASIATAVVHGWNPSGFPDFTP